MVDNVTTTNVVTFTSDNWTGDPKGASQVPISKLMFGTRDTTYTLVDDSAGNRFPVKIGDSLPAGAAVIGAVTISGTPAVTVTGSVTANAGSNLNTSLLALEAGGNLATIVTNTTSIAKDSSLTTIDTDIKGTQPRNITQIGGAALAFGQAAMASSIPVVIASNQSAVSISGTVTANAGSNLNTSALALEAGGNLATIVTNTATIDTDIKGTQPRNISQFGGNAVATGVGASGVGVPRVTVANDSTIGLVAGSAIVGKVGIDQTTPGTTNGVQVNAALPTGANVIGGVTIAAGSDVTEGNTTDSPVLPGAAGTISGKLAQISQTLANTQVDLLTLVLQELRLMNQVLATGLNINDNIDSWRQDPSLLLN